MHRVTKYRARWVAFVIVCPLMSGDALSQWEPRKVTPSIARLVAFLEQTGRDVISRAEIAEFMGTPTPKALDRTIAALIRNRWLSRLPIRGTYEFQPARHGPYASGDPWLELRVLLRTQRDLKLQIGLASAAFLRGYAEREPRRPIVLVDKELTTPPGLRSGFQVIRTKSSRLFGIQAHDGLPVSSASRLVIECALYWRHAGDLRSRGHWLARAVRDIDVEWLRSHSLGIGPTTFARVAYLLERYGARDAIPYFGKSARTTVGYFGDRTTAARFSARWRLYDSIGIATVA